MNNTPTHLSSPNQRLHAFDAFRVILLCLGFVLHTIYVARSYVVTPEVYLFVLASIHLFRMPAFFMLAGFFAEFIIRRQGLVRFLQNRKRRLLVPLLVLLILFFGWGLFVKVLALIYDATVFHRSIPWHVLIPNNTSLGSYWFLLDLLVMEVLWFGIRGLIYRLFGADAWSTGLRRNPYWRLSLLVGLVALSLWTVNLYGQWIFMPGISLFSETMLYHGLFYFGFFLFGTFLSDADLYRRLNAPWSMIFFLIMTALGFGVYCYYYYHPVAHALIKGSLAHAVVAWSMSLGLLMFCRIFMDRASRVVRYLSEASYSLYLLQMPSLMVVFYCIGVSHVSLNVLFLPIVLLVFFVDLLIYHCCIRKRQWLSYIDGAKAKSAVASSTV